MSAEMLGSAVIEHPSDSDLIPPDDHLILLPPQSVKTRLRKQRRQFRSTSTTYSKLSLLSLAK